MFIIRKIRNNQELRKCLEISHSNFDRYAPEGFKVDNIKCANNIMTLSRRAKYFRVLEYKGEICAWILADITEPMPYSSTRALGQILYHSGLKGIIAIKALIAIHEDMYQFAKRHKIPVVTTSSVLPNRDLFERILLREGWKSNPYFIYRLTN
jgi:hypothetical protein